MNLNLLNALYKEKKNVAKLLLAWLEKHTEATMR